MKKWIFLGIGLALVLAIVGGIFIWNSMNQPLYEPGMVRDAQNLRAPLVPPAQTDSENYWQVESDIQLYHFNAGAGRNVLIIHGGPGQPYSEAWPGLDSLTGEYQFHYYDQRGAGQSTRPIDTFNSQNYYENMTQLDQVLGLGAQIADIERIRHLLGEDQLIIVGHSFGAFQAALYAAEFPDHVEKLVLVTPAPMLLMPMPYPGLFDRVEERLPADMLADYQSWLDQYFDFGSVFNQTEADLVALNEEFGRYFVAAGATPDAYQPDAVHAGGWMVTATYLSMGRKHDYRPAMADVTAPVLIIHAADDIVQVEEASQSYLAVFPQAQYEVIEDAGHMVFYDQPDAFADIVGDFLR